jgi:hypothetical protein
MVCLCVLHPLELASAITIQPYHVPSSVYLCQYRRRITSRMHMYKHTQLLMHFVYTIMPCFLSRRLNWAPTPSSASECCPPFGPGGIHTRMRVREWREPIPTKGQALYGYYSTISLRTTCKLSSFFTNKTSG